MRVRHPSFPTLAPSLSRQRDGHLRGFVKTEIEEMKARMQALVYFRFKGESTYRELGLQEMKALPPKGSDVTVEVDGKVTQARVMDRREFVSRRRKRPRDLSLYLDGVRPSLAS